MDVPIWLQPKSIWTDLDQFGLAQKPNVFGNQFVQIRACPNPQPPPPPPRGELRGRGGSPLRGLGARVRTYVGEGWGLASVRTYVRVGWGLTPTLPLTPLPLSTPFTARVSSTLLPPLRGRYALPVTLSHKLWYVTHALRRRSSPRKPQMPPQATVAGASPGKPRQAPASPGKPRQATGI